MVKAGDASVYSVTVAKLMETFNSQLKIELNKHTENMVNKVAEMVEIKLKIADSHQLGSTHDSGLAQPQDSENVTVNNNYSLGESQDVRVLDNQAHHNNKKDRNLPSQRLRYYQTAANDHVFNLVETIKKQQRDGYQAQNHNPEIFDQGKNQQAAEDPELIITHRDNTVDSFLKASDALQYRNVSEQELRRKQDAAKAISMAFKDSRFGGEQEEDWERHITDFETLACDYQLRSKAQPREKVQQIGWISTQW